MVTSRMTISLRVGDRTGQAAIDTATHTSAVLVCQHPSGAGYLPDLRALYAFQNACICSPTQPTAQPSKPHYLPGSANRNIRVNLAVALLNDQAAFCFRQSSSRLLAQRAGYLPWSAFAIPSQQGTAYAHQDHDDIQTDVAESPSFSGSRKIG